MIHFSIIFCSLGRGGCCRLAKIWKDVKNNEIKRVHTHSLDSENYCTQLFQFCLTCQTAYNITYTGEIATRHVISHVTSPFRFHWLSTFFLVSDLLITISCPLDSAHWVLGLVQLCETAPKFTPQSNRPPNLSSNHRARHGPRDSSPSNQNNVVNIRQESLAIMTLTLYRAGV